MSAVALASGACSAPSPAAPGDAQAGLDARAAADADAPGADAAPSTGDGAPPRPYRPDLVANRWTLVREDLPTGTWETSIAYDPDTGRLLRHGAHAYGSYVQIPYTWMYDIASDAMLFSQAAARPQRRCLVELAYLDSIRRVATVQGSPDHGSMPVGAFTSDGRGVVHSPTTGPWLFDPAGDAWEHARAQGGTWPLRSLAQTAYDPTSDALFGFGPSGLVAYSPHDNRIVWFPLPTPLQGRSGYGIAVDPDARRLVVFGGADGTRLLYGLINGDDGPTGDNCGAGVSNWDTASPDALARCQDYYTRFVHDDTWVFDIASGQWHEVTATPRPPHGQPTWEFLKNQLVYHAPSGLLVLHQSPFDRFIPNPRDWPASELWGFDAVAETWRPVPTTEPPPLTGLMAYAREQDALFLWGGGDEVRNGSYTAATASRRLYTVRLDVADRARLGPPAIARIATRSEPGRVVVAFPAVPGTRYEIQRAPATPLALAYATVATVDAAATDVAWSDPTVAPDVTYAYRVRPAGTTRWSLPAFDQPRWPHGLTVAVDSASQTTLRWSTPEGEDDLAGFVVYRRRYGGSTERLGMVAASATSFVDAAAGLADGVVRTYWVTAVDRRGRESGPSPSSYSMPDVPTAVDLRALDATHLELRWSARPGTTPRIRYQNFHCNARGDAFDPYLESYAAITPEQLEAGRAVFTVPAVPPSVRDGVIAAGCPSETLRMGHYVYFQLVNALGQAGLYSDIVSSTDPRFTPAQPGSPTL